MTVSDRYAPGTDPGPSYPTAFGITFTPSITGAVIGVAGALAAGWLAMNLLGPAFTQMQDLQAKVAEKQSKITAQDETLKKLQEVVDRVNKAKAQNTQVRSLFSNQQALDTLLLDLNRLISGKSAVLRKFTPDYTASGVVTDSSQGAELNNKLKRQVISVEFEGTFNQTLEIMRSIDRLQTVLILKDFKMELQSSSGSQENARPANLVKSSFKLYAYVPVSEEEAAKEAPAGQPASSSGAASPSPSPSPSISPSPSGSPSASPASSPSPKSAN
jgi:type IV pilus assembly protein PilO